MVYRRKVRTQVKPTMSRYSIVLVEDSLPDARFIQEVLPREFLVTHSTTLHAAKNEIARDCFDVILLDLSLPDATGLETCSTMLEIASSTPIVILTGLHDEEVAVQAVQLGAQDYILKNEITEYRLSRAIRYAFERKQAEENSKRLALFEQREEFMATLTHDLKTPLIGANRILELMAEQQMGPVDSAQTKLLLQLRDNNKLLLSMIQNLIEVYRFERDVDAVVFENADLREILDSCINDIAPIAENRDIALKMDFSESVPEVSIDAGAVRRVVQNLLDNALKFTPAGGRISTVLRTTNGFVTLTIEDDGPGIPHDEQMQLFKRFSKGRTGSKYSPGTGLGLYLCKQIMDAHHGMIKCTSEEGVGTTFAVMFPLASVGT